MSLRHAILGLLTHDELSGYEITRRFEHSVGYFWHARSQQIYPELSRLEDDGLIAGRAVAQTGRPDKRVYQITPDGLHGLREWAATPSPQGFVKDEFLVKVWCYGQLQPEAALAALTAHRAGHEESLVAYRNIAAGFADVDAARMAPEMLGGYLTLRAGIAMEQAFVDWCREAEVILATRARREP